MAMITQIGSNQGTRKMEVHSDEEIPTYVVDQYYEHFINFGEFTSAVTYKCFSVSLHKGGWLYQFAEV